MTPREFRDMLELAVQSNDQVDIARLGPDALAFTIRDTNERFKIRVTKVKRRVAGLEDR